MELLYHIYTALMDGLTEKKNEKEIWWTDEYGEEFTIEVLDIEKEIYIERYYYDNCNIDCEDSYLNGSLNGPSKSYYESGQLEHECFHLNGHLHGQLKGYYKDGTLSIEENYIDGYGVSCKRYDENGQLRCEENNLNGKPI